MFGRRSAAQKEDDKAWYPWDLDGLRPVTRLGRVRVQIYREWSLKTQPVQGDLLLSTEHLVFSPGPGFTNEIDLAAVYDIEWDDFKLSKLLLAYGEVECGEAGAAFDLDVPPHANDAGYETRLKFAEALVVAPPHL